MKTYNIFFLQSYLNLNYLNIYVISMNRWFKQIVVNCFVKSCKSLASIDALISYKIFSLNCQSVLQSGVDRMRETKNIAT